MFINNKMYAPQYAYRLRKMINDVVDQYGHSHPQSVIFVALCDKHKDANNFRILLKIMKKYKQIMGGK